jgi:hypothetical protein
MSHVDIAATIEDVLDTEFPWEISGESIFSEGPGWAYNEYHSPKNMTETKQHVEGSPEVRIQSLWDTDGGHVFKYGDAVSMPMRLKRSVRTCARHMPLLGSDWVQTSELSAAVRYELAKEFTVGNPSISKERARSIIESIRLHDRAEKQKMIEILDEKIKHLQDLGYR